MPNQSPRPCPNLTSRISKISSTLKIMNPAVEALTSRDQPVNTHHSHRKYKLGHSQIDKIDKLSLSGLTKIKIKKQDFTTSLKESNRFAENDDKPFSDDNLPESFTSKPIHHNANYHISKDKVIQLTPQTSLRVQIIDFQIPLQNDSLRPVSVICFEVHNSQTDTHFRSQFTYQTLGLEFRLMFDDVIQIFQYSTSKQFGKRLKFCLDSFDLEIIVQFQKAGETKVKTLKLHLLPFAVVQIVQNHENQNEKNLQDLQTKRNLEDLHKDLQIQSNLVNALRAQNDQLKVKLQSKTKQIQTLKKENTQLSESYQKTCQENQENKEFFFEFVPDPRGKNISNFLIKNNNLQKSKNDLKWDQISSEAPLPHSQRHYFTVLLKSSLPDYMFGIVTLKGKDTPNAFLGTETLCLYINNQKLFVYERGQHFQVNRSVEKGDLVVVVVDRQRGVIEWMKKGKIKPEGQLSNITNELTVKENSSILSISSCKSRKLAQNVQSREKSPLKSSRSKIFDQPFGEIEFIHSIKIPQEMISHELYAYLEVYNINEPLKINEKK